jgi:thiol-disulfide isomerase/thioredoxin
MKKMVLLLMGWCVLILNSAWIQTAPSLQAVVFLSPECPLCKNYSLTLNSLQQEYAGKVAFTGVIPGRAYSVLEVKAFTQKYKISFPVVIDSTKTMTAGLKATVTPEVFLIGPDKKVYYHGSIDNWIKDLGMASVRPTVFYLKDAIDQMLAHQPVVHPFNKPVGCLINDY